MKARIELQISSETDLSVRDVVDLMHDALDNTHGIKITGIVVEKDEPTDWKDAQVLTETKKMADGIADRNKKEPAPEKPKLAPDGTPLKYGPDTVIVDDGQGQPDSVEQFPPKNNLKPVPFNTNKKRKEGEGGPWDFGTKWG